MNAPTPGKWYVERAGDKWMIMSDEEGGQPWHVAVCDGGLPEGQEGANANLIVAAPDLRRELKAALSYIREYCESTDPADPAHEILATGEAVLKQADGKP